MVLVKSRLRNESEIDEEKIYDLCTKEDMIPCLEGKEICNFDYIYDELCDVESYFLKLYSDAKIKKNICYDIYKDNRIPKWNKTKNYVLFFYIYKLLPSNFSRKN